MAFFNSENHNRGAAHGKTYDYCELSYTTVGFSAVALFVIGSVPFFNKITKHSGTWLFLIGSVLVGMRPAIKLACKCAYLRVGNYQDIAEG